MRSWNISRRFLLIATLAFTLAIGGPCFAARFVPISVLLNGKIVLKAGTGDNGQPGPDVVWGYLKKAKFEPVNGNRLEPDPGDPRRATLQANLVLDVAYGGRADITELHFVRATEEGPWQLDSRDIERTFRVRHKPFVFQIVIGGRTKLWTVERTRAGKTADSLENVWLELKHLTVYGTKIAPDGDDPLHATLNEGATIELLYAGKSWARAEAAQLKLHRDRPKSLWRIDPADVETGLQGLRKSD